MNEDTKKLEEQLERATAEGGRMDDSLDAETAALREGWLALDRLIETAQTASGGPPDLQLPVVAARRRTTVGQKTLAGLAAPGRIADRRRHGDAVVRPRPARCRK